MGMYWLPKKKKKKKNGHIIYIYYLNQNEHNSAIRVFFKTLPITSTKINSCDILAHLITFDQKFNY